MAGVAARKSGAAAVILYKYIIRHTKKQCFYGIIWLMCRERVSDLGRLPLQGKDAVVVQIENAKVFMAAAEEYVKAKIPPSA